MSAAGAKSILAKPDIVLRPEFALDVPDLRKYTVSAAITLCEFTYRVYYASIIDTTTPLPLHEHIEFKNYG